MHILTFITCATKNIHNIKQRWYTDISCHIWPLGQEFITIRSFIKPFIHPCTVHCSVQCTPSISRYGGGCTSVCLHILNNKYAQCTHHIVLSEIVLLIFSNIRQRITSAQCTAPPGQGRMMFTAATSTQPTSNKIAPPTVELFTICQFCFFVHLVDSTTTLT